jgi:signal transduction histidine kinase
VLSTALRGDDEDLRATVHGVIEQLNVEIENLRGLVAELRPAALDELGLEPALRSLVERTTANDDLDVTLSITLDETVGRLAPDIESTVYRLVQEGVRNVIRHARATMLHVDLVENAGALYLTIRDDGEGFDPGEPGSGFGLLGMRERADLVEGQLTVASQRGEGTQIEARLPARRQRSTAGEPVIGP